MPITREQCATLNEKEQCASCRQNGRFRPPFTKSPCNTCLTGDIADDGVPSRWEPKEDE